MWTYAAADVTAAYNGNSAITLVQREIVYLQPNALIVYDRVTTGASTQQTWQLALPARPTVSGTTTTTTGAHAFSVQRLAPTAATAAVFDYVDDPSGDYSTGYRLDETITGGDQRFLHVIGIDGAVASATAADDSTVTVQLTSGDTVTVAFVRANIGATLTYHGTASALGPGVDSLPE